MFVFVCAGCGAELTAPLSRVHLPAHAHQRYGNGAQLPVLMQSGTYAVEPEPWGPPWRKWEEVDPDEAAARGVYAPLHALSDGAPGAIVIAPGDVRGTLLIPEERGGACCGIDGADGPNMACEVCGLLVATRIDDCSLWQAVWLAPNAVHRLPVEGTATTEPLSWKELTEQTEGMAPLEPIATWAGPWSGSSHYWSWSPRWEAAAGRALAHLLAASEGHPVTVPNGLTEEVFQRALDALLPAGVQERHAVLAGPGLPAPDPGADILLVPVHPQTGQTWPPAGPATSAYPVPLEFGVWLWLAFPTPHLPAPMAGRVPEDVLRDEPLPPRPGHLFRADRKTFLHTVVRLPEVRSSWIREIVEDLSERRRLDIF
ncbi:hypothetical protein [Streptomyces sp. NBC_01244]|uniref:hypothetical protein n=1 Tax=Streptomyces sp. NBC_01244 TaxID=2903797 RepID=UPI002E0F64F3|nr:hypothetical protein OG247_41610 [Streptomyces sp. NBC_01244]